MSLKHRYTLVGFILLIALMTGCGEKPREVGLPQEIQEIVKEDQAEVIPENVAFWGFDEGPPEGWDYAPQWIFEEGNAISNGPGQFLFSFDTWEDFDLFSRIHVGEGAVFGIFFHSREESTNQLFFEPGATFLISEFESELTEQIIEGFALAPGWHEIHLVVRGAFLIVESDGEILIEIEGFIQPELGHIGITNHSETELMVDFVQVIDHKPAAEHAAKPPDSEVGESIPLVSTEPVIVIHKAPVAELIEFETQSEDYTITVRGKAGAVVPESLVSVANLETTRVYFTDAAEDGSFELEIFAYPGSSIQIKQAYSDFFLEQERSEVLSEGQPGEIILEWQNATTGTIMRVPDMVIHQSGEIPFAVSGFINPDSDAYWYFEGVLEQVNDSPQSMMVRIKGSLVLTSQNLAERIDPDIFQLGLNVSLVRHFDANGNNLAIRKYMVSDFLSPTGFPIYHGEIPWSPISFQHLVDNWQSISQNTISAEIEDVIVNERNLPFTPGYYALQFEIHPLEGFEANPPDGPSMRPGIFYANGGYYTPVFELGDASQPHLFWGLLTDTLQEGTRGTIARDDRERISLLPMITLQNEIYIIPKDDPKTGEPISYRLEPFLPLISYGDRGLPNPPTIDFDFPSGELQVTVHRPDGTADQLGPAPFVQSINRTPAFEYGKVRDYSNGGGAMQEVYQLTTLDDDFEYSFDQFGHYQIEMTGKVDDVRGTTFTGGGTYDLYVARPLKVYNGMLPTTPFVEGDAFSPSLQVYPRLPVDVELRLQFLPNSSSEMAITKLITGTANQYGYFFPENFEPFVFQDGGEYRLDVSVQYLDAQGELWMGSASWGNVVENTDSPLIAHGIRGLDSPEVNKLWFFHQQLDVEGTHHTYFPYYSGDIFWGHDVTAPDTQANGADAILPGISLEDTSGTIYNILKSNWETKAHAAIGLEGGIDAAIANGEVVPFSTTSSGMGLEWFPEQIDQYGYTYMSSQRPGARVHESLGEGAIPVSYWRYNGTFGDQVGVEGDQPNDLKWQFGGVVFRDLNQGINAYAAYGSLWVLVPNDDPVGARITPPFQGATGGPNGGPIMTLKGEDIDLFFLPRSGFPGQVLELGDVLSFSGHVGPPLDSKLTIIVTSPSGKKQVISGQANKLGYYYQPGSDLIVDEMGIWEVEISVVHEGMTSSGPTMEPYPTGGVLGAAEGSYQIYVLEKDTPSAELSSPRPGFITVTTTPLPPIKFLGTLPGDFENAAFSYTISMPGFVLEQGEGIAQGKAFNLIYDPVKLHEDFPNLDLTAYDEPRLGLADQIWIAVLFESEGRYLPLTITLRGEEVFDR